jgi:hypothetical protein
MTTPEFRDILQRDTLDPLTGTVVVNYNPVQGSNPDTVTVDDIAIVIGSDDIVELQEATSITFTIPQTGTVHTINLENSINPPRVVERSRIGRYFLYTIVTPEQRLIVPAPIPLLSQQNYSTPVSIEPTTNTGVYEYNVYNPLIGNSISDRESSYRVYSDRSTTRPETKTNPTNIDNILNNIATPAQVQDSLYADTGWSSARYEGTKLTPQNNNGTDPFLPGGFFDAAFFGGDIADATIEDIPINELTFEQYLTSGKVTPPRFVVEDLKLSLSGGTVPGFTGNLLRLTTPTGVTSDLIQLNVGDLLITKNSAGAYGTEIIQLIPPILTQGVFPYESLIIYSNPVAESKEIRVNRGHMATVRQDLVPSYPGAPFFYRIATTKIYSIQGTVVQAATEGKLLVRDTGEILYINAQGFVVGGNSRVAV